MLLIAGSIRIDPTHRAELIETAIEIVRELRKQVGCTLIAVSGDLEDASVLYLLQKWDSQAALFENLTAPHVTAIAHYAGKLGVREMALLKYDIASFGPVGLLGARRGTSAIAIAGDVRVDPSRRDDVIGIATELMTDSRKRRGCIAYVVSADLEDPGLLRVFEEWQNEQALRAHLTGPGVASARRRLEGFGAHEIDLERFDVRSAGPIVS